MPNILNLCRCTPLRMTTKKVFCRFCLAIALSPLIATPPAYALTITVNTPLDSSAPANACTLREAIATINAGSNQSNGCSGVGVFGAEDTIRFSNASNTLTLDGGQLFVFADIIIEGQGRDITQVNAGGNSRVFAVVNSRVVFKDLKLSGGSLLTPSGKGGGVYVANGAIELHDSVVSRNVATLGGGLYADTGGEITLYGSRITENEADFGGGIFSAGLGSSATIQRQLTGGFQNSSIDRNIATEEGGGLYLNQSTATITEQSSISENTAELYGGGIQAIRGSSVTISDSILNRNTATTKNGGGISITDGSPGPNPSSSQLEISNSQIGGNSATSSDGGALAVLGAAVTISNSEFPSNYAELTGSGLIVHSGTVTIHKSAFLNRGRNNINLVAGTLQIYDSTISMLDTTADLFFASELSIHDFATIYGSTVVSQRTAIAVEVKNGGLLRIGNSILSHHGSKVSGDCSVDEFSRLHIIDGDDGNLVWNDPYDCANFAIEGLDPMLEPLKDNGGVSTLAGLGRHTRTFALLSGSPAIDAGSESYNPWFDRRCNETTDQRGVQRPQEGGCDIGAYEFQGEHFFVIPANNGKTVIFSL